MSMRRVVSKLIPFVGVAAMTLPIFAETRPEPVRINIEAGAKEKPISRDLIGIFFEDINYAADGGLYAELVQNRSFEYSEKDHRDFKPLSHWDLSLADGCNAGMVVETESPLNSDNPHYAVVSIERNADNGVRLNNDGFGGIVVKQGERYDLSYFSRGLAGDARVASAQLVSKSGAVLAEGAAPNGGPEWSQQKLALQSNADATDARLVLCFGGTGKIAIDMVSLFPQKTFHGHGLRPDLAQTIADLQPKFMRFPGGCVSHGSSLANLYRWKDTIGPVEQRREKANLWGYHQSYGLGYFEYFQFCEDIGAAPLPVLAAGVSCQFAKGGQQAIPMDEMPAYVQDVLDLVEYANGPATSTWGAKRAEAGHPAPFNLRYMALGNEDAITPAFSQRLEMLAKALKEKHPEIQLIGTAGPSYHGPDHDRGWAIANRLKLELIDEHYYMPVGWFTANTNFYDNYPRDGAKVYLGEYAAHDTNRAATLRAAIAEAAYLTSLERNGDVVALASYAPLLGKLGNTQWNPNLIYFTNTAIVPTPAYYVQKLFSTNAGDRYLPTTVSQPDVMPVFGTQFFVGTWDTQAEFDDVQVHRGEQSLFADDFAKPDARWSAGRGKWAVTGEGTYRQTDGDRPAMSGIKLSAPAGDFVYTLRAKKLGGSEGFLIGFAGVDDDNYYWWNVGGWGNKRHSVQQNTAGSWREVTSSVPGEIESGRWYDIRIESKDHQIRCSLDGKPVHEFKDEGFSSAQRVFASAVRDTKSGDLIVKIANTATTAKTLDVSFDNAAGLSPAAKKFVLTGEALAVNTPAAPARVAPVESTVNLTKTTQLEVPSQSLTVLRMNWGGKER
jgi:alpha-L-arabinofuranosidase